MSLKHKHLSPDNGWQAVSQAGYGYTRTLACTESKKRMIFVPLLHTYSDALYNTEFFGDTTPRFCGCPGDIRNVRVSNDAPPGVFSIFSKNKRSTGTI
jgi:hypothetical protein